MPQKYRENSKHWLTEGQTGDRDAQPFERGQRVFFTRHFAPFLGTV